MANHEASWNRVAIVGAAASAGSVVLPDTLDDMLLANGLLLLIVAASMRAARWLRKRQRR